MSLTPPIQIVQSFSPPIIDFQVNKLIIESLDSALLEMAEYLQRNSPRGVSPVLQSLKGSWDVIPSRKVRNFSEYTGSIVNTSENGIFRLEGRGPGKFPPYQPGTPLSDWAVSVGIPAFLVARKIAREGTERWKENGKLGYTGLDPRSKLGMGAERVFLFALEREFQKRKLFL